MNYWVFQNFICYKSFVFLFSISLNVPINWGHFGTKDIHLKISNIFALELFNLYEFVGMQSEAIKQSKTFLITTNSYKEVGITILFSPKQGKVFCPSCQELYYCPQASENFKISREFLGFIWFTITEPLLQIYNIFSTIIRLRKFHLKKDGNKTSHPITRLKDLKLSE